MRAILSQELLSFARRRRFFALRSGAFALPLLFLIIVLASMHDEDLDAIGLALFFSTGVSILAVTVLVTPALLAHVLAEERRNNKLEVLQSAPLSAASIVLGKWLSRVGLMAAMLLAALPLNAAALLFGGVSPAAFFRLVALVFLTLLWISSLALFIGRRARDLGAVVRRSYVAIVLLLIVTFVLGMVVMYSGFLPPASFGKSGSMQAGFAIASLNPFFVFFMEAPRGFGLGSRSPFDPLALHALFAVLLSAALLWSSVRALSVEPRRVAPAGRAPVPRPAAGGGLLRRRRRPALVPLLWTRPVVWLETRRGSGRQRSVARIVLLALAIGVLEILFFYGLAQMPRSARDSYSYHLVPICISLTLAFLSTASLGAAAIHRDNERNTREVLHATPITTAALARAKVAGILSGARLWWILAECHAVLGLVTGAIPLAGFVLFTVVSLTLLTSLAAFSMVLSFGSKNSTQANVKVLSIVVIHLFLSPAVMVVVVMVIVQALFLRAEFAAGLSLGHHPVYLAAMSIAVPAEDDLFRHGWRWVPCIFYFVFYLCLALHQLRSRIPDLYGLLRDGVRPMKRHPPSLAPMQEAVE